MRILLLSRYGRLGASSRVRSFQYIPSLESRGWEIDIRPLFSDAYLQSLYDGYSPFKHALVGYVRRFKTLLSANNYDLVWIEKELFPLLPAFAERLLDRLSIPYIVDYDDALFHRYDNNKHWLIRRFLGQKIDSVMRSATIVVAGNDYLAQRARDSGARQVEIVPTVVDLERYAINRSIANPRPVVGWIGSPLTSRYFSLIAPVISKLSSEFDVRFVAVGATRTSVAKLPIEALPWSEEREVESIQHFDIGIMPLFDSPWERGKCGYKLIQYMACGLPVVASPIGVNREIIESNVNGFLAESLEQWEEALRALLLDPSMRRRMGVEGRKRVDNWYSLQIQTPRWDALLREALSLNADN